MPGAHDPLRQCGISRRSMRQSGAQCLYICRGRILRWCATSPKRCWRHQAAAYDRDALFTRVRSREENPFAERQLAALRHQFGGHAVRRDD